LAKPALSSEATPELRRNSLGLGELVFQGVTHIAPATNIVFTFPLIALQAGPAMPLSFLLSTLICFCIGNTVSQFSRYVPSSGGYYTFATRGLGIRAGFVATWAYLIYEIFGTAGSTGFLGVLLSETLKTQFGMDIPWWWIVLAAIGVIWALTHHGIQLSARTTAVLGGLELLIMIALGMAFLVRPGPGSSYVAPLLPSAAPHQLRGILAGMVFSMLALSGFEAPAPLAQEARRPAKFVGQAVMFSLGGIGILYVFASYASAVGWGTNNMAAFAAHANPYYVLAQRVWGAGWWFVVFAIINSSIGVGLACTNSASRVMYTMGREGRLPRWFGRIDRTHQTPTFAIGVAQVVGLAAILSVGILLKPDYVFGSLETIATLAVIVLYVMANVALTQFMRREQRTHYTVWQHVVVPWVATLALLPVLVVTVYPEPAWPYSLMPYVFLALLAGGFGYMMWQGRRGARQAISPRDEPLGR
jgi:amino acid transporter